MNGPNYRFYITSQEVYTVELFPLGIDKLSLKVERERDQMFMRIKLSGKLLIAEKYSMEAFKFLKSVEESTNRCLPFILNVEKRCNSGYVNVWSGLFSCNNCKWFPSHCKIEIDPLPNDLYRPLLETWDKQHNIMEVEPSLNSLSANVMILNPLDYEFSYIEYGDEIDSYEIDYVEGQAWKKIEDKKQWIYTGFDIWIYTIRRYYFREVKYTNANDSTEPPPGSGWVPLSQNNNVVKWARPPQIVLPAIDETVDENFGEVLVFTTENLTPVPEGYRQTVLIVDTAFTVVDKPPVNRALTNHIYWNPAVNRYTYNRNRTLLEVISYLLTKGGNEDLIPDNLNDMSLFFSEDINYVTGASNKLKNIKIAQITDIKRPRSSERASKGEISLKQLLEELRLELNVYWKINDLGKFQIEHYSWFEKDSVFDLTQPKYEKWVKAKDSYTYSNDPIPKKESWETIGINPDFIKSVVEYKGYCVSNREDDSNIKPYNPSNLITDFRGIVTSPDDFPDKAFVLIAAPDGVSIDAEFVPELGAAIVNGHLAIKNLVKNYHVFGRYLDFGLLDEVETAFSMIRRSKNQEQLTIPYCCSDIEEMDFEGKFSTALSNDGLLQSAEISFHSETIKLNINHHTNLTNNEDPDLRQFDDSFDLSFT